MSDKITVLFAGSFKPLHAGHISLINNYAVDPKVSKIKIFVSPSSRGNISQHKAHEIINQLLRDKKIDIEDVNESSPVTSLCKFIESAKPGQYVIASSSKDADYKRVKRLIDYYEKHSKPKGVKLLELSVDVSPMVYKGRLDEFEGKPISASILRNDIENNNFFHFKTNYPNYSIDIIKEIWKLCTQI